MKFISIYKRLAQQLHKYQQQVRIPIWMIKGRTNLIQKDPKKEQPQATIDRLHI